MRLPLSRRDLLRHLGSTVVLGAALSGLAGRSAWAGEVCADPKKLDSGGAALMASLNYTEASPDTARTCSACAFFAGGAAGCANCQILGVPTNAKGHCDSWGPK